MHATFWETGPRKAIRVHTQWNKQSAILSNGATTCKKAGQTVQSAQLSPKPQWIWDSSLLWEVNEITWSKQEMLVAFQERQISINSIAWLLPCQFCCPTSLFIIQEYKSIIVANWSAIYIITLQSLQVLEWKGRLGPVAVQQRIIWEGTQLLVETCINFNSSLFCLPTKCSFRLNTVTNSFIHSFIW